MLEGAVGGLIGGGLVYLLRKDGTVEVLNRRAVRRYRGYPSDTAGVYAPGNEILYVGPPDGWGWEVKAMLWYIDYAAAGGGGTPVIGVMRRDDALILPVFLPPRVAGVAVYNYFTQGASYPEYAMAGNAGVVYPLPLHGELKDEYLMFNTLGGVVDGHRVFVYFEEFEL